MSNSPRKLAIFSCFLFTGFCIWKAGTSTGLICGTDAEILPSAQAAVHPSFTPPRVVTTPIQQMRPGMRVVGRNPLRIQTETTIDPTPESWRLVSVRMLKPDGTYFEAELLRPLSWIHRHQAQPGAVIQLNMPELHVVGAAEVLSVSACPPIDPGDGPVVISMFKNVADNILNIYVEGETEPIGVTAGHPIWSEDRQAFIHSDQLQPGERLRSALGKTVRITSIEIRAGPEPVYNLEVAGEHVYSVTDSGLLVHNTGSCDEAVKLFSYFDGPRKTGPFETSSGRVYLTKYEPGDWLTDRGIWASIKRVTRTGKWKPYSSQETYFTTGPINTAEWGLKPIVPRTANFWKRIGGQYHTSIGTSGFELSAEGSKILINRPIASTTDQIGQARIGFSIELGADVLVFANIIYWGSQLF